MEENGDMNFGKNRSNCCKCWIFNIGIEDAWTKPVFQVTDSGSQRIVQHMEEINLLLAEKSDILILRKQPSFEFLQWLEELGVEMPTILCPSMEEESKSITELILQDEKLLKILRQKGKESVVYLVPYGVTEMEERLSEQTGLPLWGTESSLAKKTNSKVYARELMDRLGLTKTQGKVCTSLSEIREEYVLLSRDFSRIIIKEDYGASGRGAYLVKDEKQLERVLKIISRKGDKNSKWIVEGWYEKKVDLNAQLLIQESGEVLILAITKQILRDNVYIGSEFPINLSLDMKKKYEEQLQTIGKALFVDGVRGIAGIDSLIVGNSIIPIVEINVRFTLSTYLSKVQNIFPQKVFRAMYYSIALKNKNHIIRRMKEEGLFVSKERNGILVYNSACLDETIVRNHGRMFVLAIGDGIQAIDAFQKNLEQILKEA